MTDSRKTKRKIRLIEFASFVGMAAAAGSVHGWHSVLLVASVVVFGVAENESGRRGY